MTPADLLAARQRLGLSAADLGRALEMGGRDPGRFVRDWEKGAHPIPGPVGVAVRLLVAEHLRQMAPPTPKIQPVAAETAPAVGVEPPQASARPELSTPPDAPKPTRARRRG